MNTEKEHLLRRMQWGIMKIVNYRGVLVSKTHKGYSVFGVTCKTEEEVDELIERSAKVIEKSLVS